jgi:alkylhydroperoxidase family enzyme
MAEALNGAAVPSQLSSGTAASRRNAHVWWAVLLVVIGIAAVSAIVVTAVMGLTTEALIIAIFTGAFFSRCAC